LNRIERDIFDSLTIYGQPVTILFMIAASGTSFNVPYQHKLVCKIFVMQTLTKISLRNELTSVSCPHMSQPPKSHRKSITRTVTIQTQHVPHDHLIIP
jgi:hypothetical protein